jgi:hypothetical protein
MWPFFPCSGQGECTWRPQGVLEIEVALPRLRVLLDSNINYQILQEGRLFLTWRFRLLVVCDRVDEIDDTSRIVERGPGELL